MEELTNGQALMNCPGVHESFTPDEAKRRIKAILASGAVRFSRHAREQIEARKLDETDCLNTLRGGWVAEGECEPARGATRCTRTGSA